MITAIVLAIEPQLTQVPCAAPPDETAAPALALAHANSLRQAVDRLIVVVRPEAFAQTVRAKDRGIEILGCPHNHKGIAAPLAYAIRVTGGAAGWVVTTTASPINQAGVVHAIADQLRRGTLLVMPRLRLRRRPHPMGFGRAFGPELSTLTRDNGLVAMLRRARRLIRKVSSETSSGREVVAAEQTLAHGDTARPFFRADRRRNLRSARLPESPLPAVMP